MRVGRNRPFGLVTRAVAWYHNPVLFIPGASHLLQHQLLDVADIKSAERVS